MQAPEAGEGASMSTCALLEVRRGAWLVQPSRALLSLFWRHGTGTIDAVITRMTATVDAMITCIGPSAGGLDPRWRGTVQGLLAAPHIIRDPGQAIKSSRPAAHARKVTFRELTNRTAARTQLSRQLVEPDPARRRRGRRV
jgi:hypothetical protein